VLNNGLMTRQIAYLSIGPFLAFYGGGLKYPFPFLLYAGQAFDKRWIFLTKSVLNKKALIYIFDFSFYS
jgi:hypothetical protein